MNRIMLDYVLLENDLILRDGTRLLEARTNKGDQLRKRFKKKQPAGRPIDATSVPQDNRHRFERLAEDHPSGASPRAESPKLKATRQQTLKPEANAAGAENAAKEGGNYYKRGKAALGDAVHAAMGDEAAVDRTVNRGARVIGKIGDAVRGTSGSALSHGAAAVGGAMLGGHAAKHYFHKQLWKYGPAAAAAVAGAGYLAGRGRDSRN